MEQMKLSRLGKLVAGIALVVTFHASPAFAIQATLRNIPRTPHTAVMGSSLEQIQSAIESAVQLRGWRVDSSSPGKIRASIWVRHKHHAVVDIGFDELDFWIDYVSSENLDYDPTDRRPTQARGRGMKGPRIHKNYNGWVELLAREIPLVVHNPPPPQKQRTSPTGVPLIADELEKLHSLVERGVLSPEEFDAQKKKLLSR